MSRFHLGALTPRIASLYHDGGLKVPMPPDPSKQPVSVREDSRGFFHAAARELFLRWVLILLCGFISLAASARAQNPGELKPQGYVNDFANVLSQSGRDQLTALCTEIDQKAQAQIAIVTIKSLGGQPIEDYSIDLATRWGIGPKQKDRGVLILLAVDDRQYRIEVGYGLEGILPDGKVGGFGREAVPYLRDNNYDAAVLLMTRRVADVIAADRGITLAGSSPPSPSQPESNAPISTLGQTLAVFGTIFVVFLVMRLLAGGPGSRSGRGGGWWIGPMIGGGMGGGWGGSGGFGGGGFGGGGGGFGGFGGGGFGGGGASGSW
jgi:uncharacterized protein